MTKPSSHKALDFKCKKKGKNSQKNKELGANKRKQHAKKHPKGK